MLTVNLQLQKNIKYTNEFVITNSRNDIDECMTYVLKKSCYYGLKS